MDSGPAPLGGEPFSLLETMRLEDGRIARLDRHLARMAGAARRFGYAWREEVVRQAIAAGRASHPVGLWRLRLLLSPDGTPSLQLTQYAGESRVWRVAFAANPIDPHDPFVLNKTTQRGVYDAARQSRQGVDDVLLWNPRGEVTESTIGNVVAEISGRRYTPPVESGLLAGTFRAEQLEAGAITERVLTKTDVAAASRLWLINSVREWVEARLETGDADTGVV